VSRSWYRAGVARLSEETGSDFGDKLRARLGAQLVPLRATKDPSCRSAGGPRPQAKHTIGVQIGRALPTRNRQEPR
jgi:hypothetical protein